MSYMSLMNRLLVASAFVALLANHTHAADVKWAVGNAHWDAVTPNWLDGSANLTNYVAGNSVLFDDTAAGATPILVTNLLAVTNGSITISNVAKNYTLTGPGVFSNNVPLLKLGAGTLTLATTNANYGGTFAVGGGTVVLSTGAALGTAATGAAMILSNGVTLTIGNSGNATPAVPLIIAAGATVTNTANALGSGANGNVASGSASSVIYVNSSFTFGGQLTNFYGTLIANSGTTRLGVSSSGPTLGSSNAHFIVNGTLQPRNNNTTIHLGSLSGAGTLTGAQSPTAVTTTTYRVGALGTNTTFGGRFNDSAGGVNPTTNFVALTKVGNGTLTLTNNSTLSGATIVSNGLLTLVTSGSLSNSAVTVVGGAAFGVTLATAGGSTTVSNLTFAAGTVSTVFDFGTNAPSPTTAPLQVPNNLAINGTLNLSLTGNPIFPGTYPLIQYGGFSGTAPTTAFALPPATLGGSVISNDTVTTRTLYLVIPGYTLTYNAGAGGTLSGSTPQAVSPGGDGSPVTAVPNPGYYFTGWSDGSTANPRTDTAIVNHTNVTANFAATLVTTNSDDDSLGTLRRIIAQAAPGSTITFASPLSGATILLTNGQIVLDKDLTIDGSSLASAVQLNGNQASRIFEVSSGVTVTNNSLIITNGQGGQRGGGIYNSGTLTVNNSILANNLCGGRDSSGGGIFNQGTLTVNNSTFAYNSSAARGGGGIRNLGTMTVNNSTFAYNSSDFGGGINNSGTLTVNNSTFAGNTALDAGGGILNSFGTLNLTNSIVCSNSAPNGPNIDGVISSGANNLVDVNALLAPLGDYGGPTPTMPPWPGSPAIDGCTNGTVFATDQRGFPRVFGPFADIGAAEVQIVFGTTPLLTGLTKLGDGNFQFGFTNVAGASFTVWASTNVAMPIAQWINLGAPVESPAGTFQFTDPQATNSRLRFYRVTSP